MQPIEIFFILAIPFVALILFCALCDWLQKRIENLDK